MAQCELCSHPRRRTELYWICDECKAAVRRNAPPPGQMVEVERKRQVAPFVLPLAGLIFVLLVITQVLAYWH